MRELQCAVCKKPLTGGTDTFGDIGDEMCWDCWSGLMTDRNYPICRELRVVTILKVPIKAEKVDDE